MGEGCVHRNRYDGHCMKQWVKIPKGYMNIIHYREKFDMLNIL